MTNPISFNVSPSLGKVYKDLLKREKKIADFSPAMKRGSIYLDRWVKLNFRSEGGKVGGWLPFAAGGRWRKGKGLDTSAKLLRDSSDLEKSYIPFYSKNNAGIGSALPYAETHEEGLGYVPKRRTLPTKDDKEIKDTVRKILEDHVKECLK